MRLGCSLYYYSGPLVVYIWICGVDHRIKCSGIRSTCSETFLGGTEGTCSLPSTQGSHPAIPTFNIPGVFWNGPSFSLVWVMLLLSNLDLLWTCVLSPGQKDRCKGAVGLIYLALSWHDPEGRPLGARPYNFNQQTEGNQCAKSTKKLCGGHCKVK